ncbi:MAG: hypothetical protein U0R44_05260 [Candidatus Micrarchaeia archaeon]
MDGEIRIILERLSSKSVLERKQAIRELKKHLKTENSHIARLSLHYVSEHDPCYTVRNIARQAFYHISAPPESGAGWEKAYIFRTE